ncbi:unnamed protein product [Arabidopsis lyrata]|nr:unnamed protein product [Arabidopsis lyrata]
MEPNIYQLALAALFGASFVAVSGFFMHFKALNLVLERGKERKENPEGDEPQNPTLVRRRSQVRRKGIDQYGRSPASLPDATPFTDGGGGDTGRSNGHVYVDEIPPGLPRLHTPSEGRASVHGASSIRKTGSFVRPISPKSPVASASAFESVEESDDDDNLTNTEGLDASYLQANGNNELPVDANEEQISMVASSMIRSHSVSGDLHGVQPDPIAADILRKEPEQETFVRLNVPLEVPTSDEVEAYKCLQECLALRKRYVFQETVAPWEKEVISDPSTPKPNTEPFAHYPQGKSDHYFEMQDGVVHVFANKDTKEELFPVADATAFFTDLHHVLKVIAAGNIRTLCHRRLVLLEQKFNLHLMLNADKEFLAQKSAPHRDFYNVRKVDTHVHHSACMNQKHLLRFIKSKLRKEPDEVVIFRDGTYLTLREVFESLDLTGYDLNVDLLDVHADKIIEDGNVAPMTEEKALYFGTYEAEKVPAGEELEKCVLPEDDLILLAIVGIKDPCRPGVKDSVQLCQNAGVKVRMVTGDNVQTARDIALECGILTSDADASEPTLIEGKSFRAMTDAERDKISDKISVMGRLSPNDKLLLVQSLRRQGHVVAVTGDGTNDAPALHEADIGLAMGIAGTEVAKERSDIIILDENFASVVKVC